MKTRLDSRAVRTDLTDRECSKIIGGTLGALCQMAEIETVRKAVEWWAEHGEPWAMFQAIKDGKEL